MYKKHLGSVRVDVTEINFCSVYSGIMCSDVFKSQATIFCLYVRFCKYSLALR